MLSILQLSKIFESQNFHFHIWDQGLILVVPCILCCMRCILANSSYAPYLHVGTVGNWLPRGLTAKRIDCLEKSKSITDLWNSYQTANCTELLNLQRKDLITVKRVLHFCVLYQNCQHFWKITHLYNNLSKELKNGIEIFSRPSGCQVTD